MFQKPIFCEKPDSAFRWDSKGKKDEYEHRQLQVILQFYSQFYTCIIQHSSTTHILKNNTTGFNVFLPQLNSPTTCVQNDGRVLGVFLFKMLFHQFASLPLLSCVLYSPKFFAAADNIIHVFQTANFIHVLHIFIHCLCIVADFAII